VQVLDENRELLREFAGKCGDELSVLVKRMAFFGRPECCSDISFTMYFAMGEIRRCGRLTMQQLAERSGISPSAMCRAIDALVSRGFAERQPGEDDRRKVYVELTGEGLGYLGDLAKKNIKVLENRLSRIPQESREEILRSLKAINTCLECEC
jgi:DNA-binding MarR family transcriptional regulator